MPMRTRRKPTLYRAGGPPPSPVCANAVPTSGPRPARHGPAAPEGPLPERGPELAHETQVEMEVVQRRERGPEHLPRQDEMAQRTPAEVPAGVANAPLLHRARIAGVTGVADHDLAVPREKRSVARVARRQDTIKHVISHRHEAKQIAGRADTHQVARLRVREPGDGRRRHPRGIGWRLPDRQPADGIAVEVERREPGGALGP